MINNKSFVLISILLLQSLCIASVDDETTFIDNICNMTPLPENCTSLLMSDPRGPTRPQAPTLKDLTIIALDMTINAALAVYRKAADLARQYRGAPEQEPLSQCVQIYVDFITGLQEVVDNVRSLSFKIVYESVNVVAHQLVNCENELLLGA